MSDPPNDRHGPVVAIYRGPLFNPSETFIQAQATSLRRYQPILVGRKRIGFVRPELEGRILLYPSVERLGAEMPKLVHAHFGTDGLAALALARRLSVPLVTTLHGHEITRAKSRMLLSGRASWVRYALFRRRLMRGGDRFLAVSEALRRRAVEQGFPGDRTFTHYIGVDLERFRQGGEAEPGLVLHVARLVEKKGTSGLIRAFARIAGRLPTARLVIIGDGPLRSSLRQLAANLGQSDHVTFLGRQPPEAVESWMRRAWLIAAPSVAASDGDSEGLPTVLVEAAASGVPAVATDHSGIPEIVLDDETGFLVAEKDIEALADRLERLIGSAEMRHRMGAAANRLARRKFDLQRQSAILEEHYDAVVARA
jgi:colanic acid/amylovoran biosynthesis glycosyltransferase